MNKLKFGRSDIKTNTKRAQLQAASITGTQNASGVNLRVPGGIMVVSKKHGQTDTDHGPVRIWGVSGRVCEAVGISMAFGTQAPFSEGKMHSHDFSTAIFIMSGEVWIPWKFPTGKLHHSFARQGEFIYIPAGVLHAPVNKTNKSMTYLVSRPTGIQD